MVKAAVEPVDGEVGKGYEERELNDVVPAARALVGVVVKLGVSADFGDEDQSSGNGHEGNGMVGLVDF